MKKTLHLLLGIPVLAFAVFAAVLTFSEMDRRVLPFVAVGLVAMVVGTLARLRSRGRL